VSQKLFELSPGNRSYNIKQSPNILLFRSMIPFPWGGSALVHSPYLAEVSYELGLRLGTLVRMYLLG